MTKKTRSPTLNQLMKIMLTPQGEELLRVARKLHPDQSPAEILERALAERIAREQTPTPLNRKRTRAEFGEWLDKFAAFCKEIPLMPGETFSREMILPGPRLSGFRWPAICSE